MAKGRILRLRGLPWNAGEDEVRGFLESHSPVDVYLRKRGEKSTGEAFVEFATAEEAADALADRNHKDLGERYIEIFTTDAESMDALRGEIEEHDTGWVVRLRGLPFSASADEVLEFFEGLEVVGGAEGVVFIWGRDRRPLGEAYVEFPSEEVQQEAMKRDRNKMGPRYIEIFKSTKADMSARAGAMRRSSEPGGRTDWGGFAARGRGRARLSEAGEPEYSLPFLPMPPQSGPASIVDGSTLRLRGLPYSASVEDITEFFADFNVRPDSVQIMMRPGRDGQPQGTGMAYVQFPDAAEAEAARADRHRKSMGSRYIECLPMWPLARGPLAGLPPQPGMPPHPGPIPLQPGPRLPFMPRAMGPMAGMAGPGGMPTPPQLGPRPGMPGALQYEGQPPRGPRGLQGPVGRMPYGMRPQPPPPNQPMFSGMSGPAQPFDTRIAARPMQSVPSGSQPPPPASRPMQKGGWRGGGRASSPGPPMQMQGGSVAGMGPAGQLSPAEFQQQQQQQQHLMMQQQFLMHQHLIHQQQAMGHMRHPAWGIPGGPGMAPIGGPFVNPFGAALGMQARPPQQASRPQFGPPGAQPPAGFLGQPQPAPGPGPGQPAPAALPSPVSLPMQSPAAAGSPLSGAAAAGPNGSAPSTPGLASTSAGAHTFRLSPPPGQTQAGMSPTSSLQSGEVSSSLMLGSRSQSAASRAASGPIASAAAVAGLHPAAIPPSSPASQPGAPPLSQQEQ